MPYCLFTAINYSCFSSCVPQMLLQQRSGQYAILPSLERDYHGLRSSFCLGYGIVFVIYRKEEVNSFVVGTSCDCQSVMLRCRMVLCRGCNFILQWLSQLPVQRSLGIFYIFLHVIIIAYKVEIMASTAAIILSVSYLKIKSRTGCSQLKQNRGLDWLAKYGNYFLQIFSCNKLNICKYACFLILACCLKSQISKIAQFWNILVCMSHHSMFFIHQQDV